MAELLVALAFFAGYGNPAKLQEEALSLRPTKEINIQTANQRTTEQDEYQAYQDELERRRLRDERIAIRRAKYSSNRTSARPGSYSRKNYSSPKLATSKQIDLGLFTPETTLSQALDEIQNAGLPMIIMWSDLNRNAYVDQDTLIGLQGRGLASVEDALKFVLVSVSQYGGKIGYTIDNGVLTVATNNMDISKRQLRVYNVAELTGAGWWLDQQNNNSSGNYGNSRQGFSGNGSRRN